jgi:phosphoribosylanthranilate isomerase
MLSLSKHGRRATLALRQAQGDDNSPFGGVKVRTRVKFCGMTSAADVELAVAAGADAVGIIVARSSERYVSAAALPEIFAAVPPFVTAVIVSAGETDVDLAAMRRGAASSAVQRQRVSRGCERMAGGARYVKAFHVRAEDGVAAFDRANIDAYPRALALIDSSANGAFGGTGRTFDWNLIAQLARERPLIVSGGLTPGNVFDCVRTVRPYAVDVRSGIETDGSKDPAKMRAFIRAVREADEQTVAVPAMPNV